MAARTAVTGSELARLLGSPRVGGPAYASLARGVRALILDGRVPLRARLPSERALARALGVSRTTTTAAFDVLRDEGYVESRRGSGSRVALPTGGAVDRELLSAGADGASPDAIDLTVAALPAPGAMMEAVAAATRDLAGHLGSIGYDPYGLAALRRAVADGFDRRGLPTVPDQIVVTTGAQHALALLLEVLAAPGDAVVAEVPTYPNALEAMRRAGLRFVGAPMGDEGWDVEAMAALVGRAAPRLAYLIPDFQNPTGRLMADQAREVVVAAASRAGSHLVVDETFVGLDLEPWRQAPLPMAAHADSGHVITVGSMSKAYWGGLRVGWIRCAEPLARRVAQARAALDLSTPVLEQLIAGHLLGRRQDVLAERRSLLTSRRDAVVAAIRRELPGWSFQVPRGGLCLWVDVGPGDASELASAAEGEGVRLVPGPTFTWDGTLAHRVRIPYTQPEEVLDDAVARLARAVG